MIEIISANIVSYMRMNIRQKLIGSFVGLSLLIVVFGGYFTYQHIKTVNEEAMLIAENTVVPIAFSIARDYVGKQAQDLYKNADALQDYISDLHNIKKIDMVVVDINKKIIADTIPGNAGSVFGHDRNNEVGRTIKDGVPRFLVEKSKDYPEGIKQIVVPLRLKRDVTSGAVIMEYTPVYNSITAREKKAAVLLGIVSFISVLLAAAAGIISSKAIAAPIRKLKEASGRLASGDLDVRVDINSRDEIGELAKSFNKMGEDLKKYRDNINELVKSRTVELANINARLNFVLTKTPVTIYTSRASGNYDITFISSNVLQITGYEASEYISDPLLWKKSIHPEDADRVERELKGLSGYALNSYDFRLLHKDGLYRYIHSKANLILDAYGRPEEIIGFWFDVTERKVIEDEKEKLQEQLRQSQKMEALGVLAGGIAHDFNNILTTIMGSGHLLQRKMEKSDYAMIYVDNILISASKAKDLIEGLLTFSRKQPLRLKPLNLNEVIIETKRLLSRLGEDIELKIHLADRELIVIADITQIQQALINLAANSRDAMPNGGVLSIDTEVKQIDNDFIGRNGFGVPGYYAFIRVTDTGCGIDSNNREHIFEPFFTTKDVGKGTGLGLSIVYGIIEQHRGFIDVFSEKGFGTTFKIYLPLAQKTAQEIECSISKSQGGKETILIAEDDYEAGQTIKLALEEYGYTVIPASNGEEALNIFRQDMNKIHLVILDVIMPRKSGRDVYDEIRKINPSVKCIFISGYPAEYIEEKDIIWKDINFISKPIIYEDLLKKIEEVLNVQITTN